VRNRLISIIYMVIDDRKRKLQLLRGIFLYCHCESIVRKKNLECIRFRGVMVNAFENTGEIDKVVEYLIKFFHRVFYYNCFSFIL
jgi:hypothetical protein